MESADITVPNDMLVAYLRMGPHWHACVATTEYFPRDTQLRLELNFVVSDEFDAESYVWRMIERVCMTELGEYDPDWWELVHPLRIINGN